MFPWCWSWFHWPFGSSRGRPAKTRETARRSSIDILGALLLGGVVIASLIPTIYGAGTIAVTSLAIGGGVRSSPSPVGKFSTTGAAELH